jgi:hypothetical protein
MEKIDIKYLGIPNICFSLTGRYDNREPDYILQRMEHGFDDSETWSLDCTIANFILPRLKRYLEIAPNVINMDDEINDIKLFQQALELIVRDEGSQCWSKEEEQLVRDGLAVFPKIFLRLGW